ncbi:hypothetical protein PG994_006667 [Apiospora phragmitis]|uniref:Uncharacterized protein n=1 Tax=Apiospora phragmitis TaxID=2905665 RepID=A0ABR1VFN0_9PEZI
MPKALPIRKWFGFTSTSGSVEFGDQSQTPRVATSPGERGFTSDEETRRGGILSHQMKKEPENRNNTSFDRSLWEIQDEPLLWV